jgi:hypothetical protein
MKTIVTFLLIFLMIAGSTLQAQNKTRGTTPPKAMNGNRSSIAVTPLSGAVTATTLVERILGPGVTYSNVQFTGSTGATTSSAGLFINGFAAGMDIDTGIVLSSGLIQNAVGPNTNGGISECFGTPGDADLTAYASQQTYDATVLEFDFEANADSIFIDFVFGSEEYDEWIGQFNDVFAFFLDGNNIALVPGTNDPVSVNTINNGPVNSGPCTNCAYFVDNTNASKDIECDGFTHHIRGRAATTPGNTHHIKLAIADGGDCELDSWVFIEASSFTTTPVGQVPIAPWALILGGVLMAVFIVVRTRYFARS